MKKKVFISLVLVITGILISIGPQTIFKVCDSSEMKMRCYYTSRAEIGIGILLVISGILYLLLEQWQAKIAISILGLTTGIIAILIPAVIIGGCADQMMVCRSLSFPAIYMISLITILATLGNSIFILATKRK